MTPASLLSVQCRKNRSRSDPRAFPAPSSSKRVDGPVAVGPLGLAGDEQAELSVHGGPDKAVYGYPAAHYAAWRDDYPEHAGLFVAGGVGENLTIAGWTEADLCVGDVHRMGSATLQVCQPRQPCFKFALRFGDNRLPKAMVRNGRAGWYYRVLEPGMLDGGDAVTLHRPPASRTALRTAGRDRQFPPADARRGRGDGGDGRAGERIARGSARGAAFGFGLAARAGESSSSRTRPARSA